MFRKMFFITGLLFSVLLIVNVSTVHADEADELKVAAEANEERPIGDVETQVKTPRRQNNTTGNNKSSIKMIVGGQSKDGVAKSIDLPVNAK